MLLLRALIPLVTKFPFFLVAWFQSDSQEYLWQYSLVSLSQSFEASIRPDGLCISAKAYCSFTAKSIRPSSTALIGSILLELSFLLMQVPEIVLYKRKMQELKFFAWVKSRKVIFLKFEFSIVQCLVYMFVSSRSGALVRQAIPVSHLRACPPLAP